MKFDASVLNNTEKIIFALRALYMNSGYSRYTMSRFEEYDLYSRNKEFLVSDGVITFTDTNGMLMALKPDVTLSIIRNCSDEKDCLRKLCYNESVYRISKKTGSFKEIMQTGLECMGKIDTSCLTEVISLAGASLAMLSDAFILEVSDMDIVLAFLDEMTDSDEVKRSIIKCAGERNIHEITEICMREKIPEDRCSAFKELLSVSGRAGSALSGLEKLCQNDKLRARLDLIKSIISGVKDPEIRSKIEIDFSLIGDVSYYNGIVFRGFIDGIPDRVLSGGQYDRLMEKMGKKSNAVGFAVYLDELERIKLPDDVC